MDRHHRQFGRLYRDAYDEAQRIILISEEVRISLERVEREPENPIGGAVGNNRPAAAHAEGAASPTADRGYDKLTTAKLAAKVGLTTKALQERLVELGLLELREGRPYLTAPGKAAGGEWRPGPGGGYMLWPEGLELRQG